MKSLKCFAVLFLITLLTRSAAQSESITFELNGRDATDLSKNPLGKFVGEWTLKNNDWTHNWGGDTEMIKIPGHHTVTKALNTDHSILSIIDGPQPNGHILWTINPITKEVNHLSSFGDVRVGTGKGEVNANGDVSLRLVFEGEAKGTYRKYQYKWVNENEYHMKSVQYGENGEPTGLFYEGNFVRLSPDEKIRKEIMTILKTLDDHEIPKEEQIVVYTEDVVHMAPDIKAITNRADLLKYLNQQKEYG